MGCVGSMFEKTVVTKHQESYLAMLGEKPIPLVITSTDSAAHLQKGDQEQVCYLLMQIEPAEDAAVKEKSPLNLAVVIDRSTSMKGERLQKVKQATHLLLEKLSPTDIFSVISYSDRAEVVVPAGPVENKVRIRSQIRAIQAAGGTETFQGLSAAVQQLSQQPTSDYINHLVLLTDGHTYGDDEECIALAQQAASNGVGISAFGIGSEWNDFFLDDLVSHSGGQSGYIEEPEQIVHLLRQRIAGLGALFAQNLRLKVDLGREMTINEVYKITPYAQPLEIKRNVIQLGSIEGRLPLSILLELSFKSVTEDHIFFTYTLEGEISAETPPEFTLNDDCHLAVGHPDKKLAPNLMEAVRMINLTRMNDQAWEDVQAGDLERATKRMSFLTKRLEEAGLNELAMTAKAQTVSLSQDGTLRDAERMMIKYGTRKQLTRSITELFSEINNSNENNGSSSFSPFSPLDAEQKGDA